MNGIICMNKPQGFTSFDVIAKLRGILKMKRLGHAGTLDPMATGVLPVFVGSATKACDMLIDNSKGYRAGFRLGITTDTQDITGTVLTECTADKSEQSVLAAAEEFIGDIMQTPPMYSAVSVNGKRLYELARQGIEVERKSRQIHIDNIRLTQFDPLTNEGVFEIDCGKGTYVRTLIHDIGQALGCGAVMTSLVRYNSGGFLLENAVGFEDIIRLRDENRLDEIIMPVEKIFESLPAISLDAEQSARYKNGAKLELSELSGLDGSVRYTVYDSEKAFLGTANAVYEDGALKIEKNFR